MSSGSATPGPRDDAALWDQADEVFDSLLGVDPAHRAAQLEAMTLPDGVRVRVARLLASDSQAGLLDKPDLLLRRLEEDKPTPDLRGRQLGEWTLGEEIGRGGMSVVYAARRRLGTSSQPAALKLLTLGALAGHGHERFLREQDILARLEHPNIAALLDVGVLEDGTPWMAMARINGMHIDQWSREQQLGVRDIARLFLEVCDTVEFAHRNLVIHRDIKPSNVLVDPDGHVYLLDFGIARLVEDEADQATRTLAITPRYAAPEQFSGANPSTSMDVYGLGALLYCLLTGAPPRESSRSPDQAPVPLASHACTDKLRDRAKLLRGDLDALLARALAASTTERYATAGEMATDLRNWLARRPINARRQSAPYRLRKFAGRHRWGVAAGFVLLLTVVAGVAASLWQAQVARANAESANAVKDFMLQIFQASGPDLAAGKDATAAVLLERGANRVRRQFADRPALRAQMLGVIGETQQQRGTVDDAAHTLDDALAAFAQVGKPVPEYAHAIKARASIDYDLGHLDDALGGMRRADRVAAEAGLAELDPLRVEVSIQQANIQVEANHPDKAETRLKPLLERLRAAGMTDSYNYAYGLDILGAAMDGQDRSAEAIPVLQQSLKAARQLDAFPTLPCDVLNDLGIAQYDAGQLEQSISVYHEAISCARRYYGEYHQLTQSATSNLAWVESASGHPEKAAETYERLMPVLRHTLGDGPSVDSARLLAKMALARDDAGREDAVEAIEAAWLEARQLQDTDATYTDWIEPTYGMMLFERGDSRARSLLGPYPDQCDRLDDLTRLHQRICIARLLLALDQNDCPLAPDSPEPASMDVSAQHPWLAGYWLVRQRCSDDASTRKRTSERLHGVLAKLPSPPVWLLRRLTTAEH
ncbi:MAG: serine/threonine-protein kinase [Rhodanobacteraceae bacterium]